MDKPCLNCKHRDCGYSYEPCSTCVNYNRWENPKEPNSPQTTRPDYYHKGGVECFAAIDAATDNLTGADAFDTGNAIKYLWRWADKNGVEDLRKATTYIQRIIDRKEEKA